MQLDPNRLFFVASDDNEARKLAALLGASGVDLTPELAIDDLGEQIDFVMNFVLSQKNKAHVIDLLTMRQEASTDLAITLSDA
jgi:hypothetical protein